MLLSRQQVATETLMIGLYALWQDPDAVQSRAAAFAPAFRVGEVLPRATVRNGALVCDGHAGPGQEPARTPDGSVVLLHGYIESRARCRAELGVELPGDAAIYAAGYARWGEDVDQHLTGEYATILVEGNGKRVRIARSPIKSPALYFWRDGERLIATTVVQAIFSTGEVARELDEQKIADSLLLNYHEERRGWFRGVTRLPRGSRAWITPDGIRETVFYRIEDIAPVRFKRDSDYVEAASQLFHEAVEATLEGFERPAISLSGGMDSQAVAAFTMRARPGRQLLSYTSVPQAGWTPPDSRQLFDERPHVEALAAMYPELAPHWIDASGLDATHHQRDLFEHALVPPRNASNLHWIHEVCKNARDDGADVVLTGTLGNLTFSFDGQGLIPDLVRQGRLIHLMRELWHGGRKSDFPGRIASQAILPFLPVAMQKALRLRFGRRQDGMTRNWSPLNPELARDLRVEERAVELGFDPDFGRPVSVLDFRHKLMSNAANEGGDIREAFDRMHGIPTRDPTSHRPLLEFCFAIPPEQYLHMGTRRWLARRMLRGKVPDMVANERRRGRQAADWSSRLRPRRQEVLTELEWLSTDPTVSRFIDLERLRNAVENMPENDEDITVVQAQVLNQALNRGLATARFMRFINGRNDI